MMTSRDETPWMFTALGLLALMRCEGIGGQRALRFALSALTDSTLSGLHANLKRPLSTRARRTWETLRESAELRIALEWAEAERDRQALIGARIVGFFDEEYPLLLRLTPQPPPALFVRGDLSSLGLKANQPEEVQSRLSPLSARPAVAIVGTRYPTPTGRERTREAARRTAGAGGAVISGLALGVDGVAHQEAVREGAYTVAVLGHGLDRVYPDEHAKLAAEILACGGALISEQPYGTHPMPRCLVARDRIQSGLASGVIVVETSPKGGAMHAARAALKQGRPIAFPIDHRARLAGFMNETKPMLAQPSLCLTPRHGSESAQIEPLGARVLWLSDEQDLDTLIAQLAQSSLSLLSQGRDLYYALTSALGRSQQTLSLFN